jgi:serine phosphatase RsbU (regulator of sigma subunit)
MNLKKRIADFCFYSSPQKRSALFLFCFFLSIANVFSQPKLKIDSLEKLLFKEMPDSQRVSTYDQLANLYRYSDPSKQKEYALKALRLSRDGNISGVVLCDAYNQMGLFSESEGRFKTAIVYYDSSMTEYKRIGSSSGQAKMNLNIANAYVKLADFEKATEFVLRSQKLQESLNDTFGVAVCKFTLGNIYYSQGNKAGALRHYLDAWQMNKISIKNIEFESVALANIGSVYEGMEQYDSAIYYIRLAGSNFERMGYKSRMGSNYNSIGTLCLAKGELDSALFYHRIALAIGNEMQLQDDIVGALTNLGDDHREGTNYDSALHYYSRSLQLAKSIDLRESEMHLYEKMSNVYKLKKDYQSALEYTERYYALYDSLHGVNQSAAIEKLKKEYALEKSDTDLALARSETAAADERNRRNLILFIGGGIIALVVIGIILWMFYSKQKHNRLLTLKNEEILKQKTEIEIQQGEITASINYAKRIQEAILPSSEDLMALLPNAFVLWQPRDIVSGDFYWLAQRNDKTFIACVDCTGHGVPGAFMSMIGNTLLNEIVLEKEIEIPGDVLDILHVRIRQALRQRAETSGTAMNMQDGMDIAFCSLEKSTGKIEFAGANRPLLIIRNGLLEEISPDKQAIGGSDQIQRKQFTTKETILHSGDSIYLFTDGYADQFGGPQGKKMLSRRLTDLLISIYSKSPQEQQIELTKFYSDWKGALEQVDDVCIIGIRI